MEENSSYKMKNNKYNWAWKINYRALKDPIAMNQQMHFSYL